MAQLLLQCGFPDESCQVSPCTRPSSSVQIQPLDSDDFIQWQAFRAVNLRAYMPWLYATC